MASATLTSKGQITLPKAVLDRLHLGPGDQVYFVLGADGRFDLIPVKANIRSLKNCAPATQKAVTIKAMANAIRARAKRTVA